MTPDERSPTPARQGASTGVAGAYAMLALTMAFWAGNAIIARAVRDDIPPFTLALARWSLALAVLAPFAMRRLVAERRLVVAAWRPILLLGLLGVGCFNAFLYSGLRHTTATNAMLLQAATPALVLLADLILFRAVPRLMAVGAVALSTVGVAFIVLRGELSALGRTGFNLGDLLVLGGVLCWALYTSLLRLRPGLHPLSFLAATFAVGVVAMLPLAGWEWAAGNRPHWTLPAVLAVGYVALLPSIAAFSLFNAAVTRVGSGPAGQAINLMPVFGALLASALLAEPLHAYHFAGMALVLLGLGASVVATGRRAGAARSDRHK